MSSLAIQLAKGNLLIKYVTYAIWVKQKSSFSMCNLDCIHCNPRYLTVSEVPHMPEICKHTQNRKVWCSPKGFTHYITNPQILSSYCLLLNTQPSASFFIWLLPFQVFFSVCFVIWLTDMTAGEDFAHTQRCNLQNNSNLHLGIRSSRPLSRRVIWCQDCLTNLT